MGEFKESEHPRDKDGKFTEKGKGNTKQQKITKALNTYANKRKSPNVTNQEWALWYNAIGDIELGVRYEPEKDGNKYITIGNKIFVTTGTYAKPVLNRVIEFDSLDDLDDFIKDIEEEELW